MTIRKTVAIAMVVASALGCVKTGTVAEKQPVASLSAYKSASVTVEVPSDLKNAEQHKTGFVNSLSAKLKEKKVFMDVAPEGGDVSIKVTITKVDEGNTAI